MLSKNVRIRSRLFLILFGLLPSLVFAIDAPRDVRGTEVGQSVVKWEWASVPGAAQYEVTVDGAYAGITRSTQYYSRNLWQGDHSMTVRSVGSDGSYSGRSSTIKINVAAVFNAGNVHRSYVVDYARASSSNSISAKPVASSGGSGSSAGFQAPQNPRGSETGNGGVRWEWNAVSGASRYEVTVDGNRVGETSELQFASSNLWIGEHSMTVKAIDSSGRLSEQSNTVKLNVTSAGGSSSGSSNPVSSAGSAPPPPPAQGDQNAAGVQSFIDPASYNYPEVSQKSGYQLVFSDEFNGTALNPYRWHSQLRWDGEHNGERYEYRVVNGEDQFYVNILGNDPEHKSKVVPVYNPFQFDGSRLAIRAAKNPLKTSNNKRSYGSLAEMSSQQTFLSGAISSHDKFSQKYGYFEARIKIPSHVGTFPAFWLFHERRAWEGTQRTEIDVMENLGHAPWYVYNSFHYFKNVTATYGGDATFIKPNPSGQIYTGTDYSEQYHVYAVDWAPGRVTWYIDGQQVSEMYNSEANFEELYVMLNLAMGGNWTNFPTNSGGLGRASNDRFPTQNDLNEFKNPALEIDYVRVYKRK